ncbi:hypothetical protein BD414DRAFT_518797 [Trametes punicea]|nr:hypothetical protein BD414DRAFT_518797 [Trametes punicea]
MEYLSEDHANLLLAKEWLVKVDNDTSTPYLFKFYASTVDLTCIILITDTKSVWGEVLSSNQIARRWRECNQHDAAAPASQADEESWRANCLEFLAVLHSLGGVAELNFELAKSKYSDLAFELRSDPFRWRWETFNVGPKLSATILSKHLIMPLISVTHLAFSSPEVIGSLSEIELEKSTDRIGRIARRTVDTHVKSTLSKPIVATTLRRMTAVFNFVPEPPRIVADVRAPELIPPSPPAASRAALESPLRRATSPSSTLRKLSSAEGSSAEVAARPTPPQLPQDDDSVTEEEPDEDESPPPIRKGKDAAKDQRSVITSTGSPTQSAPSKRATPDQPLPPKSYESRTQSPSDSSSLHPLPKKPKRASEAATSSDEESQTERRIRASQVKSTARRGVKQPIKRGGRRF